MEKNIKFFLELTKATKTKSGKKIIKGIASGTLEDRDGERMSLSFLEKFKNSLPLPLTDAHQQDGIFKDLGMVITGEIKKQSEKVFNLEIKAELEDDNVASTQLFNNLEKGKKYGLSIEAKNPKARTVYSEITKSNILEFYDAEPVAISVTTKPSYIPSMLEVLSKSYKELDKNQDISNIYTMEDDKKTIEKSEEITPEMVENTETVAESIESTETVEEVKKPVEETQNESKADNQYEDRLKAIEDNQAKILEILESNQEIKKSVDSKNQELIEKYETLEKSFVELKKSFDSIPQPKKSVASLISKNFESNIDPDLNSPIPEIKQKAILRKQGIIK
jgi:hypothetical protein